MSTIKEKQENIHSNVTQHHIALGKAPSLEGVEGAYPTVVTQPSGRKVPVVQAYAYTKYLGRLQLTFDDEGEIIHMSGDPVLIDGSFEKGNLLDICHYTCERYTFTYVS